MNWRLFKDSESNVLFQKSSFLRSLLDWVIVNVPNFDSENLVDLTKRICKCSFVYFSYTIFFQ
jgi:hypothetical protein